jgi:ATP-dependent helicase/nuclease subunit A
VSEVKFTAAQLDAVDIRKRHLDACVVAGPGSGKTTVLVEYFRRLVAAGIDPLRILAITFTEKAAGNMRKKLAEAFRDDPTIRARLERAWVSTVHGFCARLLKENAVFAGVDPEFYVADERESWRLQNESMSAAMEQIFQEHPVGVRALIRGLSSFEFEEAVLSAYDAMRGAGVRVEKLAAFPVPPGITTAAIAGTVRAIGQEPLIHWRPDQRVHLEAAIEGAARIVNAHTPREALAEIQDFPCRLQKCKRGNRAYDLLKQLRDEVKELEYTLITEHYAPQRQLLLDILRRFDQLYRQRKRDAGALDFSDLEEYSVRLLEEHAETRARLQGQFDQILMDEFQDTNGQQARLLELIRPADRFYAVGDINQSIFGFRHAEPQGFQQYREQVQRSGRHLVELIDNFRSRADILSAVETVLNGRSGIDPRTLVAGRTFDEPRPVCVEAVYVHPGEAEEAGWVARRILDFLDEGFELRDIAVLVRNTEVLGDFSRAFDAAGVPYVVNRGRGFYETREVNDLTHLLRIIANARDEISMAAVLRSPLVLISDEALLRLRAMGDNLAASLMRLEPRMAAEFGAEDYARLLRFRQRLHEWRVRREHVTFDRLLLAALDDCGYHPETGARGEANIDKFLGQVRSAAAKMSLDEFVEELALVRDSNPREPDAPPEDSANAVKVMTVHSAKGLEFPVVFVAALHKGIESNPPVVAFSRVYGLGARWRNPAAREDKDDLFQHHIRQERKQREEEESHRLFYVAMTRAEQHLVLSFSGKQPKNWAGVAATALNIDLETRRDEVTAQTAPDGKTWNLRVVVTDRAPELRRLPTPVESEVRTEYVSLPEVTEQQDTNATVTAVSVFADCPRRYYLGGYLKFSGRTVHLESPVEDGDLPAAEFGTQVHELLAGKMVAGADPEAERLAGVFRQSPLGRRAARAMRIEREFDFLMSVEDLVVRGQVDLWFEEGGELVIVDYKTNAVTAAEARSAAQQYAVQLRLYAMAVERTAGRPPDRAFVHFLRPDKAIEVDLRPGLLDAPEQVVRDFQEAQSSLQFPLNEGPRCRRCEFLGNLCPAAITSPEPELKILSANLNG